MRWRAARDPGKVPLRRRRWALRRASSAVLAAGAAVVGLTVLSQPAAPGLPVLVAAHDLAPGEVLAPPDVSLSSRSRAELPRGTLRSADDAVGRVLSSGARAGEVLTDVRLVGPRLVDSLAAGEVAAPVRVADASAVSLVGPGDRVDVLVAVEGATSARTVVRDATVLVRPRSEGADGVLGAAADDSRGGLLVLSVGSGDAQALAGAAALGPLSLVLRRD
ncbi:MAG TPA: Flp pilus assembly protein CpaB [Actinomycetales bacterium]|nr:Flp pilus assembly protein CpaB [Actinomycetales bacterium]